MEEINCFHFPTISNLSGEEAKETCYLRISCLVAVPEICNITPNPSPGLKWKSWLVPRVTAKKDC